MAKKKVERRGRPKTRKATATAAESGCEPGWRRYTVQVRVEIPELVKRAAYWERPRGKDIVEAAFEKYLKDKDTRSIPKHK